MKKYKQVKRNPAGTKRAEKLISTGEWKIISAGHYYYLLEKI